MSRNLSIFESATYSLSLLIFIMFFIGKCWINLMEKMRDIVPLGYYLFVLNIVSCILVAVMMVAIFSLYYIAVNVLFERERSIERGFKIVNILSLISIICALVVHVNPDQTRIERMLEHSMFTHSEKAHLSDIAFIQERLSCCGVWKYWDWDEKDEFNCNPSSLGCTLPRSCFKFQENITTSPFYTSGCHWEILKLWEDSKDIISHIGLKVFIITVIFRVVVFYILTRIHIVRTRNELSQERHYHSRQITNN